MYRNSLIVNSLQATKQLAQKLVQQLNKHARLPVFIQLSGTLGSGKTTFAKFFIEAWFKTNSSIVIDAATVVSPTYNLVKIYGTAPLTLAHFDLYRIHSHQELEQIGFDTVLQENACCLVEWLENGELDFSTFQNSHTVLKVHFDWLDHQLQPETRQVTIETSLKDLKLS